MGHKRIRACLFDLDGTLLNTEDIYTYASSQVLARYGKGPLTWDIKLDLQGRPGPEAARRLLLHYELDITPEDYMKEAYELLETLWHTSEWLPGARQLVRSLHQKGVPLGLGTGSSMQNYKLKTERHQDDFLLFNQHIVTADDPRVPPGKGKPHPDIWLICLESINQQRRAAGLDTIAIDECLVFEDGIPGVLSAKNANATVVWVPHPDALVELDGKEVEYLGAHENGEILGSLSDFEPEKYGL